MNRYLCIPAAKLDWRRSDLEVLRKRYSRSGRASNALCDGENINGHCLSVIEAREAHQGPFGRYSQMVKIFILAILAFALCSCADSYEILGLHLKRGDQYDNVGHGYVSGSGDPGN
jgi:hypothetical protein